jgi:death-on-curing protein
MADIHYFTSTDLIVFHELLMTEFGGMRGITEAGFGRLESAVAVPRAHMFGADIFADTPSKAAALCEAIVRSHPFTDGNKRLALVVLDGFLTRHGYELTATNDEAYAAIMALARGELPREALIDWVKRHLEAET